MDENPALVKPGCVAIVNGEANARLVAAANASSCLRKWWGMTIARCQSRHIGAIRKTYGPPMPSYWSKAAIRPAGRRIASRTQAG